MADAITVATVQPSWKRLGTADEVRDEVGRYLRLARNKGAGFVILPEHIGLMLALPLAGDASSGVRGNLLKKSVGRPGFWGRLVGALSGGAADMLGGLPALLPQIVDEHSDVLHDLYVDLFGTAAREHGLYLVAGSIYLRAPDGQIRAVCGVFDRTGALLGWQAKLHLSPSHLDLAVPGDELTIFETDFGRLGVLLGSDILYPELTRALAYRGVTAIACPAAVTSAAEWQQLRIALNARAQENQIYLAQSFLIGENELRLQAGEQYQGRSAVVAPVVLTPHQDGVLIEVGSATVEAVVSAEWNFADLRNVWETATIRPRAELRGSLFEELLRFDYESGATIEERVGSLEEMAVQPALPAPADARDETVPEPEQPEDVPTEEVEEDGVDVEPAAAASDTNGAEDRTELDDEEGSEVTESDRQNEESSQPLEK